MGLVGVVGEVFCLTSTPPPHVNLGGFLCARRVSGTGVK
jgi:hypothetical protein